jgi:hypothetical protein
MLINRWCEFDIKGGTALFHPMTRCGGAYLTCALGCITSKFWDFLQLNRLMRTADWQFGSYSGSDLEFDSFAGETPIQPFNSVLYCLGKCWHLELSYDHPLY